MTRFSCKVFPSPKKCCVCLEKKYKYNKCSNSLCSDGIICNSCFKKMTPEQKTKCPVCRTGKNNFEVETIEIITDDTPVIIILQKRKKKKSNCEIPKMMISIILCMGSSYILGLLTWQIFSPNPIGLDAATMNPIVYMVIGCFIIIMLIFCFCNCRYQMEK